MEVVQAEILLEGGVPPAAVNLTANNYYLVTASVAGLGTQGNLWNNVVVSANGVSNSFSMYGCRVVTIAGNASAATTIQVQYSVDNTHWYSAGPSKVLSAAGDFGFDILTAAAQIRLMSTAAATITATAMQST